LAANESAVAETGYVAYSADMLRDGQNITLIGMPGVGKSTVGVLLAKAARRRFLDTDLLLQARTGRALQEIINTEGLEAFLRLEEACVLELDLADHVIATGGSVVYSESAMRRLQAGGPIVHLDLPIEQLERRLSNLDVRGVVMPPGWDLRRLAQQRMPLYRQWADLTVDGTNKTQDQIVAEILHRL